jgi:hypothetical protein
MSLNAPKRPPITQEKVIHGASTVAAIAATTTIPLGTMDADYVVDKWEIENPGGYTSDAAAYYDVSLQIAPKTFTAVAATDICTVSGGHKLVTGDSVQVTNSGGGLPGGLSAGVTYFAIVLSPTTFKLADTNAHALAGTNVINITTNGTGTQSVARVLAMYSLKTITGNGDLVDGVLAKGTLQPNPTGFSGDQLNAVMTKFSTATNLAASARLISHAHQL